MLGGMDPFGAGGSRGSPHGPHVRETPAPPLMRSSHRMPAKETRGKACGPIGCKEAVRAEIAPAQLKASGGGIVRAVPRACLGLARFVLRPASRFVRQARKEPPCCTDLLNVREYSAN